MLAVETVVPFDPFRYSCRIMGGGSKLACIAFMGGGIPMGGGGGTDPPKPRGIKSSLSSSVQRSVKSKSHNVSGRVIFFISSSQCSSFSDFFGSGFLISWSLLGDLRFKKSKDCIAWVGEMRVSIIKCEHQTHLEMSPLLLLFARPSLAFEISPLISPMRFWVFSS